MRGRETRMKTRIEGMYIKEEKISRRNKKKGIQLSTIEIRFWIVSLILAVITIITLKVR